MTITLPSKWAQEHQLQAGDNLEIQQRGKDLLLTTEGEEKPQRIELDTIALGSFYYYYLAYYYKLGYDEVRIVYDKPEVFDEVKKKTSDLLGFEITETGRNYVTVRTVSHEVAGEFDAMLRRIFLLIKTMGEECLAALRHRDQHQLQRLQEVERTNNKLTDFCIRILHKHGYPVPHHTLSMYALLRELEQLCDYYQYICSCCTPLPDHAVSEPTMGYFSKVHSYYCLFYELYYKFSEDKANSLFSNKERLLEQGNKLLSNLPVGSLAEERIIIHHLLNITQNLFNLKGPYFQMQLSREIVGKEMEGKR